MFRRIAVLVVALVFALGISFTFAQEKGMMYRHHHEKMMKGRKDKVKARVDELTKELNLTPEQGLKIKEILAKSREESKKILEEAKSKVKEVRIKAHEEIKALLTEEQKKRFQETRHKHEVAPKVEE